MGRRWLFCVFCVAVLSFCFVQISTAKFELRVNEDATRLSLDELSPEVSLVVENGAARPLPAVVEVKLLDTDDYAQAIAEQKLTLKAGSQNVSLVLPIRTRDFLAEEHSYALWYRLHYRIQTADLEPVEGTISISKITPELFELRVISTNIVREATRYQVRVQAAHPMTSAPAANVKIHGVATLEDTKSKKTINLTSSATSNRQGEAELFFNLPGDLHADELELVIEGSRGLLSAVAKKSLDLFKQQLLMVSTDKPIYQPGQTMHSRVVAIGPSRKVLAGKEVSVKITDPDDTVVFSSDLTTSRLGVASVDWPIPDSSRLGRYTLEFKTGEEGYQRVEIKLSRYELPTFTVNITPDRSYYLPGQNATVAVKADYLFGQPVTRGQVKVVRETERNWNYREQRYDTVEGTRYEGTTSADGSFTATINLDDEYKELKQTDYRDYIDLQYAAYFTDSTTNRTEQRRFNLRLSKEPIHVYSIWPSSEYQSGKNLPLRFYVSTFYPDGTPAQCNVTVTESPEARSSVSTPVTSRVKTNRYGLATIDNFRLTHDQGSSTTLNLTATDNSGRTGHHTKNLYTYDDAVVRVVTNKHLLAPAEPIHVSVYSTEQNRDVTLAVVRDWTVLQSQVIHLENGKATTLIPYKPEFKDEITIAAYYLKDSDSAVMGEHTVLYPRETGLQLRLQPSAKTFQPGEQAHVSFQAIRANGRPAESALGVVVLDRAVEERVRTDEEFGSNYSSFYGQYFGPSDSLGAITRKSLEQTDTTRPVPPDLDLAAEILLNQNGHYVVEVFNGDEYEKNLAAAFSSLLKGHLDPLVSALVGIYEKTKVYPTNELSLVSLASSKGIDLRSLKDPWGTNYRPEFRLEREFQVLVFESAGPDKRFDTTDDFQFQRLEWPYFKPTGEAIDKANKKYHEVTGETIDDVATLRSELAKTGIDLDSLRDPWNQRYSFEFGTDRHQSLITVKTSDPLSDQGWVFPVWQSRVSYFDQNQAKIDAILAAKAKDKGEFPRNEPELRQALEGSPVDLSRLRDPFGNPYYSIFRVQSFYGDDAKIESRSTFGQKPQQHITLKPVTKRFINIQLRSIGEDKKEGTADDFTVGAFSLLLTEQASTDNEPQAVQLSGTLVGQTGVIAGVVVDALGAAIPSAKVAATLAGTTDVFTTETDGDGRYVIKGLPRGSYEVRAEAPGFKSSLTTDVLIPSLGLVELNVTLEVGAATETVTVSSEAVVLSTSASVSVQRTLVTVFGTGRVSKQALSTPRVREFFPETLLWQPELTTDKQGRAQLDFKLADNITTWKMSVIGSTEDGELGSAETELQAFQPFFAELDPPRVLTEGDRISLPVVLRNYLDRKQSVAVELKPESWFSILDSSKKRAEVPAGDSQNQTFDLKTIASIKDGKQRVTALGSDFSDAIEKPVTVHPDGEERAETTSNLLDAATTLSVDLPVETIPNSAHVELKVYPNLTSHIWESVEGIMKRPYGCGEQTISSTYPSLLALRYLKNQPDSPLKNKARRYFETGFQRLMGYQSSDGGFTYWGSGVPDVALTAYALRFLKDASDVTPVSSNVVTATSQWLLKQQQSDGRWRAFDWDNKENPRRSAMLTALVTRTLAASSQDNASIKVALGKALDYVSTRSNEIDEPYLIASYALAAAKAGESARAEKAVERLLTLAHSEGNGTYWSLEANTPFYGWGLAGRLETSALAVQALATTSMTTAKAQETSRNLQTRGLLFLLKNQDRYGCWWSTQATINVLDALLGLLTVTSQKDPAAGATVEVLINGQPAKSLELPQSPRLIAPVLADITAFVKPGNNRVELRRGSGNQIASVQVVNTYYVPWSKSAGIDSARKVSGDAESLRLEATFDKTEARALDEVTCHVKAERIGFHGYGMLLAEIGLPPGADVDRASLETAIKGAEWSINHYDVLPDRVVLYLWPRAGGTSFSFKFKPRLAMTAKSSASMVYDYYNPEARAVVAPSTFVIR